ncbi:MAG TPA: N-6 DNA methylase [Polyangiaceae bacterium]|nr:N-6 DNA methylase [Polyangiaceae bacterium]
MRRARAAATTPGEEARRALAALIRALPDAVPGGDLERAFSTEPARAREALVTAVTEAAFTHAAAARGLVNEASVLGLGALRRATHETPALGAETSAAALEAALRALAERRDRAAFAALEPDELGAFYEGLLATGVELAREDSVVVAEPRPAGGAPVDRLVALTAFRPPRSRGPRSAHPSTNAPRGPRIGAGRVALLDSVARRRSGSHYTPRALTERVVADTLAPLLGDHPTPESVLALRVCDPAMGTGAFLVAACRYLAERLLAAELGFAARAGAASPRAESERAAVQRTSALRRVAERCLFGVDRDELAVGVARQALWLAIEDAALPLTAFDAALRAGESLTAFDWNAAFSEVFARLGGFDAFVGNPPWVSYAGRAAQPLAPALRNAYARFEAFHGYKNLQGLFVERAARLLRPGGRLGFVLPSSMSELAGYRPTRRAHDRLCAPDALLPDLGADAFDGVFQPCMVLRSTRRAVPLGDVPELPWPVERPDLDRVARALIDKLARPPLPPALFGERGLQSTGEDGAHLVAAPSERHSVPLRSGSDVEAFGLKAPSAHADPAWFGTRLRATDDWARVRFLVRQTARVPVAALSDGVGFRNSLLAGFEDAEHSAAFLVAYLNSTPIRWLHYARHRDARQGMPQLKIAHLRATPAPPTRALVDALETFGAELSSRGRGIFAKEQTELDELVADAFELDREERKRLADFCGQVADARPRA